MSTKDTFKYPTSASKIKKCLAVCFVAATSLSFVQSATAYEVNITEHSVEIGRVALKTEAGLQETYQRLVKKAERVCRLGTTVNDEGRVISFEACKSNLLEQFVESIEEKTLIAYHKEMVGAAT